MRWIEHDHPELSVRRQCALLGIPRSQLYYEPVAEKPENLELMCLIDEQYLKTPFWGSRNIGAFLWKQGHQVNRKRIQRLMRKMGLEGMSPGPSTSRPTPGHKVYPYLLKDVLIERPNQVWSSDITYVPLGQGYLYLVAVMDWYSRLVLSWRLSNSLDADFCVDALDEALEHGRPEISHGPGGSVHQRPFHRTAAFGADRDQHGRPRSGPGQRVHRAVVAKCQVRRHLPQGVRFRSRLSERAAFVFQILLPRTSSSIAGLPHALGSPQQPSVGITLIHLSNRARWSKNRGPLQRSHHPRACAPSCQQCYEAKFDGPTQFAFADPLGLPTPVAESLLLAKLGLFAGFPLCSRPRVGHSGEEKFGRGWEPRPTVVPSAS